jgi:hypothetical protein
VNTPSQYRGEKGDKSSVETQLAFSLSVIQTCQFMQYSEIITVCSEIHTKHINTLCGQNVEFVSVKVVVHILTTGRGLIT